MRSLHHPKNKTQSIFRGWDTSEIIEWMEVDYKDSIFKMIKYRLKKFYNELKTSLKQLFYNRCMDEEEREFIQTKKALDHLLKHMYNNSGLILDKYKIKVEGLRTYVTRLSECDHTYLQPLWIGLSKIESNSEFVRYVKHFLESLWD